MIRFALVLLLAAGLFSAAHAGNVGDTLNLQYRSVGPLQIEITGPRALVERAQGLPAMPQGGCGYTLEWGDMVMAAPSTTAPYCKIDLKHTYAKAGRYEIRATVADPKDPNAVNGLLQGKMAVILN